MPMKAMMVSSTCGRAAGRAARRRPAERQGREDRDRVDIALVEDAEDDVDRERAARISRGSFARDAWKAWAVPAKLPRMLPGIPIRCVASSIVVHRLTQGSARREVERDGNRRGTAPDGSPRATSRSVSKPAKGAQAGPLPRSRCARRCPEASPAAARRPAATSMTTWYWFS